MRSMTGHNSRPCDTPASIESGEDSVDLNVNAGSQKLRNKDGLVCHREVGNASVTFGSGAVGSNKIYGHEQL